MKFSRLASHSIFCGLLMSPADRSQAAVIDLFTEGAQSLILQAGDSNGYIKESLALHQSALSEREVSLSGRGFASLTIHDSVDDLTYSLGGGDSLFGSFRLKYTSPAGSPANLMGHGEDSFLLRFEEVSLSAPVDFSFFYYSTQWKGYLSLTLPEDRSSVEILVPFSDFGLGKPNDFGLITSVILDFRSFAPGDSLKMRSFTTVPEPSFPVTCAMLTGLLLLRHRRG